MWNKINSKDKLNFSFLMIYQTSSKMITGKIDYLLAKFKIKILP